MPERARKQDPLPGKSFFIVKGGKKEKAVKNSLKLTNTSRLKVLGMAATKIP